MGASKDLFMQMREAESYGRRLVSKPKVNQILIDTLREFTMKKQFETAVDKLHDKYGFGATFKLEYAKMLKNNSMSNLKTNVQQ